MYFNLFDPEYSFYDAQSIFLKFLGLNYLFAFGSLYLQLMGLYGSRGIAPIRETMAHAEKMYHGKAYFRIPTLFWFKSSDAFIKVVAGAGILASIVVLFGGFPVFFLTICWMAYLSFMSVGSPFLSFQWDCLLLEVGFVSIFFAMLTPPPLLMVVLMWVILFKLIFSSGVVKLLSRCPEWKSFRALDYHYETQPLPNRIAYYMHQQPRWFSRGSVYLTFFLEIAVPFLIFGPPQARLAAFVLIVFLQLLIMFTGNYAFFNTLTIALCVPLLSDQFFGKVPLINYSYFDWILYILLSVFALAMIVFNALVVARLFRPIHWFSGLWRHLISYYLVNSYGLFARMTTVRNEIIIEGSADGQSWKTYEFKWKPGALKRPPRQVAPHQPRLDWQMWFAALGSYHYNRWVVVLIQRLLEGSEDVTGLLGSNPFPDKPPMFIRAQFYQYHFTHLETKKKTGEWWVRTYRGQYTPTFRNIAPTAP